MTTALLIVGGVLLVVAFFVGLFLGRKSVATSGVPTPPSANAVASLDTAADAEQAASAADASAQKKSEEVLNASDADTRARVARLRARGRAGE